MAFVFTVSFLPLSLYQLWDTSFLALAKPLFSFVSFLSFCRLHNKSVYLKMGIRKMLKNRTCKDLHRLIKLEVDGKHVELPQVEGIIVLNILR